MLSAVLVDIQSANTLPTRLVQVKDIRDKALAMELYLRQAKDPEPERRACEIRLRAERKAGQLLAETEMDRGGGDHRSRQSTGGNLSDLGISKYQTSRWQQEVGSRGGTPPTLSRMLTLC